MSSRTVPTVVSDAWSELRRHTPARIALGRSGISLPTAPHLAFQLAHAQARDAVHRELDVAATAGAIGGLGLAGLTLRSEAADRHIYLRRPDLGRRLDATSIAAIRAYPVAGPIDVCVVVADGLSALAVERHAAPFLGAWLDDLRRASAAWRIGPVALVRQGRVAVGDDVGEAFAAALVVVLIGERPGLSSPDSMGLYLTWAPRRGRHDAQRNCISNIRPEGLAYTDAARRTTYLVGEAFARRLTGVDLKDESTAIPELAGEAGRNFLLAD